ncbi:MAG: hypothetical protein ABI266_05865 [Ginsengibacter sp.]
MRKNYFLFISLLFFCVYGSAQSIRKPIAASYIGLGAYSLNHVDAFSFTANQASLAQIKSPAFGVYGERRFLLASTNMYSAVFVVPTKEGNFGFQADYFGYKNYNESQLGIAYARSVGKKVDIGVKFNYYSFRIPAYQSSSTVDFEIGAIAHLTDKLHAGIHIYNPVGGKLSKTDNEKLGAIYKFGVGYEAGDNFIISAEIIKNEDLPVNVNAGVQYNFAQQFYARAGIATENESPFAGAGVMWNNLRLDMTASYHPQLGISPGIMLIVNFKPKQIEP